MRALEWQLTFHRNTLLVQPEEAETPGKTSSALLRQLLQEQAPREKKRRLLWMIGQNPSLGRKGGRGGGGDGMIG